MRAPGVPGSSNSFEVIGSWSRVSANCGGRWLVGFGRARRIRARSIFIQSALGCPDLSDNTNENCSVNKFCVSSFGVDRSGRTGAGGDNLLFTQPCPRPPRQDLQVKCDLGVRAVPISVLCSFGRFCGRGRPQDFSERHSRLQERCLCVLDWPRAEAAGPRGAAAPRNLAQSLLPVRRVHALQGGNSCGHRIRRGFAGVSVKRFTFHDA